MKLPHHQVTDYLTQQGFKQSKTGVVLYDCDFAMYRHTNHSDTKHCLCNDKVPQIVVKGYHHNHDGCDRYSYEVEIVQENILGWVNFSYYGLSEETLTSSFDSIEKSLILAWEASFKG